MSEEWAQVIAAAMTAGASVAGAFLLFLTSRFKDLKAEAQAVRLEIGRDFAELKSEVREFRQALITTIGENREQATSIVNHRRDIDKLERRIEILERRERERNGK